MRTRDGGSMRRRSSLPAQIQLAIVLALMCTTVPSSALGAHSVLFPNPVLEGISRPGPILSADFDGDGPPDIAVVSESPTGTSGEVFVLHGNGDDGFTPRPSTPLTSPRSVMVSADFNGD